MRLFFKKIISFLFLSTLLFSNNMVFAHKKSDFDLIPRADDSGQLDQIGQIDLSQREEDIDKRIMFLNRDVLDNRLLDVEKVLGELPVEAKPKTLISNFYNEGSKIINLIRMLIQYKKFEQCQKCLDAINELFFLQFYEFISELPIDDKVNEDYQSQFGGGAVIGGSNYFVKVDLKTRLLEILFKVYSCQNKKDVGFEYSYDKIPMALVMTGVAINIFRIRKKDSWLYEKKKSFLTQRLDEAKKHLFVALDELVAGTSSYNIPRYQDLSIFIDSLKNIAIEKPKKFPWIKVLKWVGIGTLVTVGVAGVVWAAWNLRKGMQDAELKVKGIKLEDKQFDQLMKMLKGEDPIKIQVEHSITDKDVKRLERVIEKLNNYGILGKEANAMMEQIAEMMAEKEKGTFTRSFETLAEDIRRITDILDAHYRVRGDHGISAEHGFFGKLDLRVDDAIKEEVEKIQRKRAEAEEEERIKKRGRKRQRPVNKSAKSENVNGYKFFVPKNESADDSSHSTYKPPTMKEE